MRPSKIPSASSGWCPWTAAFSISLMLLIAFSKYFLAGYDQFPPAATSQVIRSENVPVISNIPSKDQGYPPVLAYWIYGTSGDVNRIMRLLKAVYHPRNQYLLQLDAESSEHERSELVDAVQSERVFRGFGNVNVVGKSYAVNQMGSSALSALLHAAALFLKLSADWDWFINLSASDYPLVTQDDLLHAISSIPRDLNFIDYISMIKLKQRHKINQVVVDPSLYLQKKSHLFYAVETRQTPNAFEIFGGSPWLTLTRAFTEYCVQGWENLPRKLLMYFSNTANPLEFYFHTVLCNSPQFQNTTVTKGLRHNILENHKNGDEPDYFERILASGAAFARPFKENDLLLDKIDGDILNLMPNGIVPGKWCLGFGGNNVTGNSEEGLCSNWGSIDEIKPGAYGIKLATQEGLPRNQCHQTES